MPSTEIKNFDSPDEVRPFEGNGKADVLKSAARRSVAARSNLAGAGRTT